MDGQNTGRVSPTPDDLCHVKTEQRRVAPIEDLKSFRSNDKALNQQMGMKRDAKTDLINPNYKAGNPFQDCKRLSQQGLKPQQIAVKMSSFGYPKATIQRAMRQAIPQYRNMSQKQFNQHFKHHIQPAMRTPQAVRNQARMQQFKQQKDIPKNVNNMQSLGKAHKLQQQEIKTQAKARATHERGVVGQNRKEGVMKNAASNQYRKPANDNQHRAASRTTGKTAPRPAAKPGTRADRSAARARIEATRQQRRQNPPQRTMRR